MNENIIIEMQKYINNVPNSKEPLFKEMWVDLGKNVISRLGRQSKEEVLNYLKQDIDMCRGSNMNGSICLGNCAQQFYCKLKAIKELK